MSIRITLIFRPINRSRLFKSRFHRNTHRRTVENDATTEPCATQGKNVVPRVIVNERTEGNLRYETSPRTQKQHWK
jgi:hypothetical protein